jgi:hypothetical protein
MHPIAGTNTYFVVLFSRLGLSVSELFPEPPVGGQTLVDFSLLHWSLHYIAFAPYGRASLHHPSGMGAALR